GDLEERSPSARRSPGLLEALTEIEDGAWCAFDADALFELRACLRPSPGRHELARLVEQGLRRRRLRLCEAWRAEHAPDGAEQRAGTAKRRARHPPRLP